MKTKLFKTAIALSIISTLFALTFVFRKALELDSGRGTGINWNITSVSSGNNAFDFALSVLSWPDKPNHPTTLTLNDVAGFGVILNFWASWCESCAAESKILEKVWRTYKDQNLLVLGVISMDDPLNAVASGIRDGKTYPLVYDTHGKITVDYGLVGVPQTVFIHSTGVIARSVARPLTTTDLKEGIAAILPKTSSNTYP